MIVQFSPPDITDIEINEVIDTLKSGWITTGPKTKLFEQKIAQYVHTAKAVCLNSATAAMEATLRILGVGAGDEVITSAYTYTASASVINHVGAKIVLVDTAPDSYEMDYDKIPAAMTSKTKVIIPVDYAGVMCDYDKIFALIEANRNLFRPAGELQTAIGRITVIADAAHSFGAARCGKQSGAAGDFTCFSFHAVKNLTTGEGGAVTWRDIPGIDNEVLYKRYMLDSLHGQSKDALAKTKLGAWEYDIVLPGYKSNMTDIMSSLGLGQLKKFSDILKRRRQIIEAYDSALLQANVQVLKHFDGPGVSSGHLYPVRLTGRDEKYRNYVIEKMAEKGIATNVHYKPLPMHTAYKRLGFDIGNFPEAFAQYQNEITLPLHTLLSDEQVAYVTDNLKALL